MHVLVAVDDSDPARTAVEHAVATYPEADLTALHVVEPSIAAFGGDNPYDFRLADDDAEDVAEAVLERTTEIAEEHDVSMTTEVLVGSPARAIVEYAGEEDVDRIVLGSHGRTGVTRILLGSVAERVVRRAPVSVTVVR